jgi:hypothetical protein
MEEAMSESFAKRDVDLSMIEEWWSLASSDFIADAIQPEEVLKFLKTRSDSAPGSDFVRYSKIKEVDPSGAIMASLFNKCLALQLVPSLWLKTRIVMLHKKPKMYSSGDEFVFKKFRPISLTSCVYKCFESVFASRLSVWAADSELISTRQRLLFGRNRVFENSL